MDSVLQLTPEQRGELFIAAAQQSGIDMVVLEKDFWVCWTLKELFGLPTMGEHLIFKGGTSLSKVFKIINRFSEDIDVSIDRGFLGYGGANEPEAGTSNKEKQRRVVGFPDHLHAPRLDTRAYPATPGAGALPNSGFRVTPAGIPFRKPREWPDAIGPVPP